MHNCIHEAKTYAMAVTW